MRHFEGLEHQASSLVSNTKDGIFEVPLTLGRAGTAPGIFVLDALREDRGHYWIFKYVFAGLVHLCVYLFSKSTLNVFLLLLHRNYEEKEFGWTCWT